jgi:Transposase DDE domain
MTSKLSGTLVSTLSAHIDLSKSRLETLASLIILLVNVRTVNLTHIAAQFSRTAKTASSYRRLQRFFQFVSLDEDWLARAVIKLLNLNPPWILCLDRTNWKIGRRDVNILMLAVVTRRVRIPLMWTMLDKQGSSNSAERIALMQRYLDIFGPRSIRWFLADREFIGPEWIGFLLQNKVLFSIRIKAKMYVTFDDGRTYLLKSLLRKAGTGACLKARAGRFSTMPANPGTPLRFNAKRLKDGELLIVVTNANPDTALRIYKKRWFIECLFGDSKTRGLNMEDTRMTDLEKLSVLVAVISLAMVWAYACAKAVKGRRPINKAKHGYLRKSWFRTGFDQLRNWIFLDPDKAAEVWSTLWPKRKTGIEFKRVV